MARYHTVIRQWSQVESEMAKSYGVSLKDLFTMSWRRFTVLFEGAFNWTEVEEEKTGVGSIASTVDWDSAEQKPVKDLFSQFTTDVLPTNKPGTKLPVDSP